MPRKSLRRRVCHDWMERITDSELTPISRRYSGCARLKHSPQTPDHQRSALRALMNCHKSGSPTHMNVMRNTTKRRGGMAPLNPTLRTGQSSNSDTNLHADTSHPQRFANGSTSQKPKPKKGKAPRSRPTHCKLRLSVALPFIEKF